MIVADHLLGQLDAPNIPWEHVFHASPKRRRSHLEEGVGPMYSAWIFPDGVPTHEYERPIAELTSARE